MSAAVFIIWDISCDTGGGQVTIAPTNRNLEDVDNEKEIESKDINFAIEEIKRN